MLLNQDQDLLADLSIAICSSLPRHMGSFQYVCDSEQMLSLFGCRVSNDLNFEWHFMLHDILAGYFLCTAGYDMYHADF